MYIIGFKSLGETLYLFIGRKRINAKVPYKAKYFLLSFNSFIVKYIKII